MELTGYSAHNMHFLVLEKVLLNLEVISKVLIILFLPLPVKIGDCRATVFPIKSKFSQNIWLTDCFDFLFWFSSAILLSKMKSLFLNLYTSPQWLTSLLQLLINAGCVY